MKQDLTNRLVIHAEQLAARSLGAGFTASTATFAHHLHHLDYRIAQE